MTARQRFKEVSMDYLCYILPWIKISIICTGIKSKVSVSWHWTSVNDASIMPIPIVSNNLIKIIFW